ncbi:cytochrome P450 [Singulisphaera sp. Ch08]|uniref:Cytochrome P450 n=1 Tax=Singulisphaera sp. Ch08 TaxID=3120278 RepID=A0AAU7CNT6_9BACT
MSAALTERVESPPGPKGNWLSGNLPAFRRDRLGFLTECARTYGDVVAFRLGPRKMMIVNHPDLVEEVLVTNNRHYIKHFSLRMTEKTLGNGLLTSEGDFWRRQRRLAQPAFHRERIAAHAEVMVAFTERMLQHWHDGAVYDVQEEMMRLTLEIIAKTLFDADVSGSSADLSAAMETVLRCFTARVNTLIRLPYFIPTPNNVRLARAVKRLDAIIFEIIARRRASGEDRGDLLSMLLNAQDENDGDRMTDRQLRDEAMTLFMAGHETTANTLTWAWYLLAQHPESEARLHEELDQVLGDRAPTLADLPRLPFAEHVITESLRVHPTVWLVGREAIVPTVVGGYRVPVGTTVYMSQWVVHRDPRFFDDPESFRPERWQDGLMKRIPRYAYFPFGGGPRICIGNNFAMMESVLLLATIAQRFRLGLQPGTKAKLMATMTLRADGGLPMVVSSRRGLST